MKTTEDIEQTIENANVTIDPKVRRQALDELITELDNSPVRKRSILRTITFARIAKLAAAMVFVTTLVGLDQLEPGIWSEDQIRRLVYVAITRARHRLYIPYVNETELIKDLMPCVS